MKLTPQIAKKLVVVRQDKHTHTHTYLRENTRSVLKSSKSITQLLQTIIN